MIIVVVIVVVVSLGFFFSVIYYYVDQQMRFEAKFDTQNKKNQFPIYVFHLTPFSIRKPPFFCFLSYVGMTRDTTISSICL